MLRESLSTSISVSACSLFGMESSRLMREGTGFSSADQRRFLSFKIFLGGLNMGSVLQQSIMDLLHRIMYSLDTKLFRLNW